MKLSAQEYQRSRIALRYWLQGRNYFQALKAMEYGEARHVGVRKDKVTPEFSHQVAIANYLRTLESVMLYPEATLVTVFLHDVVEDCDIPIEEIGHLFGDQVRASVWLLTKVYRGDKKGPAAYFEAIAGDPIASIVKGGDRVHNQQSMPGVFTQEKQREYISECETWIVPMLKMARRNFPAQEPAYENVKHMLGSQIELLRNALG